MSHYCTRDYDEALRLYEEGLALDPNSVLCLWQSGMTLDRLGRFDESLQRFERAVDLSRRGTLMVSFQFRALCRLGRMDEARAIVAEVRERAATEYVGESFWLGPALLDGDEQAIEAAVRLNIEAGTGPTTLSISVDRELEASAAASASGPARTSVVSLRSASEMTNAPELATLREALANRYDIQGALGSGGMATVYRARDLRHDREVAVKVLRPDLAESLGRDRFLREIHLAARLTHPHILPLYDSGEAGEFLFFVMPVMQGETLRDRLIREPQLPIDIAVRVASQVADALDYAHRSGVVHRDVKPENILLHEGHALVADFGIGKAVIGRRAERYVADADRRRRRNAGVHESRAGGRR